MLIVRTRVGITVATRFRKAWENRCFDFPQCREEVEEVVLLRSHSVKDRSKKVKCTFSQD